MDAQELRNLQEAYMDVYQLDEISLKTKMKAYSASRDVDADYNYGSKVHDQGDRIKKAIVKKHGEKAGEHAERAAEVQNFGRGTPRAKPRIEKNRTYRTTKAGSMHGQDQAKLKSDLKKRRNEEYDIYDIILSHLLDEGYAETQGAAEAIMVNMSEEWREDIMEISDKKVAAVGRRRQANVDKAMSSNEYISDKPGATQNLATKISQKSRFDYLNKKRERRGG
jgi:hypothetical protein